MQFPTQDTSITLHGPAGAIEALLLGPENELKGLAIVCHPHPLFEGTMHNKVVTTLARALRDCDYGVVRFNFRGVGKTAGSYDEGKGEAEDLSAIISWLKQSYPDKKLILAGFSFGSYVVAKVAQHEKVAQLILVAPPVHYPGFAKLTHFNSPVLVIQGEKDEIVAPENVYEWIKKISPPPQLIRLPNATHFFHGQLGEIKKIIEHSCHRE